MLASAGSIQFVLPQITISDNSEAYYLHGKRCEWLFAVCCSVVGCYCHIFRLCTVRSVAWLMVPVGFVVAVRLAEIQFNLNNGAVRLLIRNRFNSYSTGYSVACDNDAAIFSAPYTRALARQMCVCVCFPRRSPRLQRDGKNSIIISYAIHPNKSCPISGCLCLCFFFRPALVLAASIVMDSAAHICGRANQLFALDA